MQNAAVAGIFDEIADLLELKNANPFRVRAYRRAARSLEGLSENLADISGRGELENIPGVGPDLAEKIRECLATGDMRLHAQLLRSTPSFLLEMLEIPGVGPKTANVIYRRLKPSSLENLKSLAAAGRVQGLPGIQEKTEKQILEGIEIVERRRSRTLLGVALPLARHVTELLGQNKAVVRAAFAGSVRRMCETVGDIDILVSSASPQAASDAFVRMESVWKVLSHGHWKSSVVTREGLQIDLRVVEPDCFGAALLYFTGSKVHNIRLRGLAKRRGWKINEYGLFQAVTNRRIACSEEEIYGALGLEFVPPELREDRGEIEAAQKHKLPKLVEAGDILGDLHVHSDWSDGHDGVETMVREAVRRGLKYLVFTDHSKSLRVAGGLTPEELSKQAEEIRKAGRRFPGIRVLCGAEVDIRSDGSLDYGDEVLKKLDFAVASIHSGFKQSKEAITSRLAKAMRNPWVSMIGHPTGRLLGERNAYEADFEALFKESRRTGTLLELNGCPQRLDLKDVLARQAAEAGAPLAVTTDAHMCGQLANLEYGAATARRAWCRKAQVMNCLEFEKFREFLEKKRKTAAVRPKAA